MTSAERKEHTLPAIAADVAIGLRSQPKRLPPRLFYDAEGSRLFDEITQLPEYYLTRTEHEILRNHAREMLERAGSNLLLVELGAGTACKTTELIAALLRRQLRVSFYPIDVSPSALQIAEHRLTARFPEVKVHPIVTDFTEALPPLATGTRRRLVLFLGSSIGNFEQEEAVALLRKLRARLDPGDCLLLGTDMAKSPALLIPAYHDVAGVTERFNKNLLARINRELGGHFDLHSFRHVVRWNRVSLRMEMYLESLRPQTVTIDQLGTTISFEQGERIHTENSYKYTPALLCAMLQAGGFRLEQTWTDPRRWFAETLARAV